MTSLDLYRFIKNNDVEYHYQNNNGTEDVIIFPYDFLFDEFNKLLPDSIYDDGGITCIIKKGYFAVWMKDICEYFGIELNEVFEK